MGGDESVGGASEWEIVSLVALVASIVGLLVYRSATGAYNNVLFLVVLASLAIGLIQSLRAPCPPRFSLKVSSVGAGALLGAFLLYAVTRGILDGQSFPFSMNLSGRENPQALFVIAFVSFAMTLILSFLVAQAARPIISSAQAIFSFGAEGVSKINNLVAAIIALIATVVAFWTSW